MEALECWDCHLRIGWIIDTGPIGLVLCDCCMNARDERDREQQEPTDGATP